MRNKAVYIALGVQADGTKDILGLWIENTEGAKFWLRVMNELKNRGVGDVLIAVVDGLKGFPEAINAVFPHTIVQTCIVHLIRHSMDFASWKDRKVLSGALKAIYRAKDADAARAALEAFDASPWGQKYPAIAQSWRRNWERVIPFFAFPSAVRRIIYTTNAIEALNAKLRRAVRTRGHFPTDEAATKLLFLVLRGAAREWKMPPARVVRSKDPVRHHVRRKVRPSVMVQPAPHTRFLTVPRPQSPGPIAIEAAVRAAITSPWSNGQTEGRITRLKLVKRQMYGRGKIDLLQARPIGAI